MDIEGEEKHSPILEKIEKDVNYSKAVSAT